MAKTVNDFKLNVKPIFFSMEHRYYYEGPCRMAGGEAIQPGFDRIMNGKIFKGFSMAIENNLKGDDRFNVLDPVVVCSNDYWEIRDEWYDEMLADDHETDFYLVNTAFGVNTIIEEFCKRTSKPVAANPTKLFGQLSFASPVNRGADVIFALDWQELKKKMLCVRVEKIVRTANILCATRFSGNKAIAGGTDSFDNLNQVTDKLGTHFRFVNVHELIDMMKPLPEGGNHTTPGRFDTNNITEEDIKWCEDKAEELMGEATDVQIVKKYIVNSLRAYKTVDKVMDYYDCAGFTAPCPDVCSTRRFNEEKFTLCFTHSLNLERGVASACEYDVTAALVMLIEMAVAGKAAYMGNTLPLPTLPDGSINWPDPKYAVEVDDTNNLYMTSHSTPCRCLHGFDAKDPFTLRHFALDQGFGAIQRHDFQADAGQKITLCRISSDCERMFIATGDIVAGFGFDSDNCNSGFVFRVNDINDFFQKHATFGLHLPVVYGDYSEELKFIAERLGLEPVMA